MILNLLLTLKDDIVLSATSATAGEHRTLDYIPGAALLGVAARALYKSFGDDAWAAFHAGAVSFGDGLPLSAEGAIGYPAPLSFHYPKGVEREEIFARTINRAVDIEEREQLEQWRGQHVTLGLSKVDARRSYRLRTAIENGRAKENALFGLQALARGQRFFSRIVVDEARLSEARRKQIEELFSREIRVGRSRSSEYGRVDCRLVQTPPADPPCGAGDAHIHCWAISDLALENEDGFPTTCPSAASLGLGEGDLVVDWSRTFIRVRRYSPYNAALGAFMRERELIERGSVITLRGEGAASAPCGERMVGRHTETGAGRILIGPLLLSTRQPVATRAETVTGVEARTRAIPSEPILLRWAKRSWTRPEIMAMVELWVQEKAKEAEELYKSARRIGGRNARGYSGPSAAQWGRIIDAASNARLRSADDEEAWRRATAQIFGAQGAIAQEEDEDWSRRGRLDEGDVVRFRDWLQSAIRNRDSDLPIDALGRLAKKIKDSLDQSARASA